MASPKLEPEDIDLLNALMSHDSLVPEPSVVIPELQINHEIDNKEDISEATPPPPSPFTTLSTTDVQPIIDDVSSLVSDKIVPLPKKESEEIFVRKNSEASTDTNNVTVEKVEDKKEIFSVSAKIIPDPNYNDKEIDDDNIKSDNEINEDLEVKLTSIQIQDDKKQRKILKDLDESANLIDDFGSSEEPDQDDDQVFQNVFRPQIDCDVLNSIIEEENDEDIQSNVSSLVLDKIVPLPKKESDEIFLRKNRDASTDTNNVTVEKVEVKKELFSVSAKIIPDPNYNGKETDVDDDDEDEDNKDLYHSTLVTTCVDSDEDNTADYDLEVPNESFGFRPQPVGCSSDSPTSSSASSNIVYDSLEDEPKSKRSLPALPKDHDLQQKRAYEIFRQHWVPSVEDVDLTSTPVNDQDRLIEGRSEDNYEYNYHLNLPAKRQLPKPPPVSPLIFDKDSGCASLENNHQQQKRNSPEPPNFLWVGLEDSKQELKKKQPKNHERLNATKKKLKPKNKESKSKSNPDRQYFMGKRVKIMKVGVFPSNRNVYVDFIK